MMRAVALGQKKKWAKGTRQGKEGIILLSPFSPYPILFLS
jgi:hypothetical protein